MNSHLSKYALVGIVNFSIGNLIFIGIYEGLDRKFPYMGALLLANIFSIPISHFNQRKLVWKSNAKYLVELSKFVAVNFPGIVANFLLLPIIIEITDLPVSPTQVFLTLVIVIGSYLAHRDWTFK